MKVSYRITPCHTTSVDFGEESGMSLEAGVAVFSSVQLAEDYVSAESLSERLCFGAVNSIFFILALSIFARPISKAMSFKDFKQT